jgi:hypothetical protein
MRVSSVRTNRLVLGVLLLAVGLCFGQATRGTVAGTVTDKTGAVVTGATVVIENTAGGDKRTVTTGANGEYRAEALNPGTYLITVTAASFAVAKLENVVVNASVTTPVNITLQTGTASETITVEAGAAQVQTESGELSGVIAQKSIKDLPILSGNPYFLATTLPGVATDSSRDSFTNGSGFSVDGLRPRGNNFLIDGFDNNDNGIAGQALQPTNQEAVQEVTVLTNSYTAEYGRGGASVSNLTFKSGTNVFHGATWYQYSGSALFAVKAEEAASGLTKPPHVVNNLFGFRVGGPVIKDRLFLFGTSQWTRAFGAPSPAPTQLLLPTAAGVSALQSIGPNTNAQLLIDSLGGLRGSTSDPTAVGTVNIGNRPGCGSPCNVEVGPFTRTDNTGAKAREWTVRADYLPTPADNLFVRYTDTFSSFAPDLFANPAALPTADTEQSGPARNLGVMWAHTFSPRVLNELRFSGQLLDFGFNPTAASLANPLAHVPGLALASSFQNTVWGGFSQGLFPQFRSHKTLQFQDAVSIVKGSHTFKLGADIAVLLVRDGIPFNSDGLIVYSGGGDCSAIGLATCTDLANYIDGFSGPAGTIAKQFGNPTTNVPTDQQAYYFQGSWKARANLTLDYGVRYEYQPPDASNSLAYPAVNRATVLTDPFQQKVEVQPDRNNWGPRFGFSYSPRFWSGVLGENKTVIRGGAGMFYDAFFTNISNNTAGGAPNTLGGNIFGGSDPSGRGTANAIGTVAGITPTVDPTNRVDSVVSNLRNPLTYQWNLNVQRELPGKLIAEVAYVGTRAERLWVNEQLNPVDPATGNRLNPNRGAIVVRGNGGDSIYHGFQTQVSRSVGRLVLRGAYTWSRAIDNMSEVFATSGGASRWQVVNDPRSDRGPSAFHHTHRAVFTWVYDVPAPKNMGVLSAIVGGWSTSGNVSFQSGAPETVFFGGYDQNGDGEGFNDRPSLGNPRAPLNFSNGCLNDPACITGFGFNDGTSLTDVFTGAPGTLNDFRYIAFAQGLVRAGNVPRNSIYFPGRQDWNLSVLRRFPVPWHESNFELRADFFNAFNHPNEGVNNLIGFGNLLNPAVFGNFATTKAGGRQIQFWLKYSF